MRDQRSQRENTARVLAGAAGQSGRAIEPKRPKPREDSPAAGQTARACGECRVCCTLFEIPEVSKALNAPCRHQSDDPKRPGCKIYENRPQVCRSFECAWKLGLGVERDRPDQLGIMLYTVNLEDGLPGLAIVEATPGSDQKVKDAIARLGCQVDPPNREVPG